MIRKIIGLGRLGVFIFLLLLTIVGLYFNIIHVSFAIDFGISIGSILLWFFLFLLVILIGLGLFCLDACEHEELGISIFLICLFLLIYILLFGGSDIGPNALLNYQVQKNKPYLLTQCGLNPKYINQVKQDDKKEGLLAKEVYMNCLEKLDNERSAIQPNVKGKYIAMFNSKGNGNFTKEFKEIKSLDKYVFENTLEILNKKEEQNKLIVEKAKTIVSGNNRPNDLYDILKAE